MLDLKYIFQHRLILENFTFLKDESFDEQSCICKACLLQSSLLMHIHKLFFLGLIFPPIYLFLIAYKFYAIYAYRKELNQESNNEEILEEAESSQTLSKLYDFNAHISINKKYNKWCKRCITAFTCEMCIVAIIICAVKIKK